MAANRFAAVCRDERSSLPLAYVFLGQCLCLEAPSIDSDLF